MGKDDCSDRPRLALLGGLGLKGSNLLLDLPLAALGTLHFALLVFADGHDGGEQLFALRTQILIRGHRSTSPTNKDLMVPVGPLPVVIPFGLNYSQRENLLSMKRSNGISRCCHQHRSGP